MSVTTVAPKLESGLSEGEYRHVHAIQGQLERKFENTDLFYHAEREFLAGMADKYANTYAGTFEFMLDMRKAYQKEGFLNDRKAKGVLNCVVAEWRRYLRAIADMEREQKWAESKGGTEVSPPNEFRIPEGTYTVVRANGEYHTLQIRDLSEEKCEKYKKPKGSRIIKYLNGPDNTRNYAGFGWVLPDGRLMVWGNFQNDSTLVEDAKDLLSMNKEGVLNTAKSYAMRSGRCSICGRELTNPDSIEDGIGPICMGKMGF